MFNKIMKFATAALYLCVPVFGWLALARSLKQIQPGEKSIVTHMDGTTEILEKGLHFHPFPGDQYGPTVKLSEKIVDLGAVKIIRLTDNEVGVKTSGGHYDYFGPGGEYTINVANGETFDASTGIVSISDNYRIGAKHVVTIDNGWVGESYHNGKFVLLEAGKHELEPNHRFVKKVSLNNEVVDLGALKIITVKDGHVAVINGPQGNIIKEKGKYDIKTEEGYYFKEDGIVNICPQVLPLAAVTVMCSDKIEMKAQAVLAYKIEQPILTVGSSLEKILEDLKSYAEGTLRSILRRFSSSDVAIGLHDDENHSNELRERKLTTIHDECVNKLDEQAKGWGLRIKGLQFTHILPADEEYHKTLRELGTKQSTAEANRNLAENEAKIAIIKAESEKSKLTNARIQNDIDLCSAETAAKVKQITSEAEYAAKVTVARAESDSMNLITGAQIERMRKMAETLKDVTGVPGEILKMEAQSAILKQIPNPVFVQPHLGTTTSIWKDKSRNQLTLFNNNPQKGPPSSNVIEYLALESAANRMGMPHSD